MAGKKIPNSQMGGAPSTDAPTVGQAVFGRPYKVPPVAADDYEARISALETRLDQMASPGHGVYPQANVDDLIRRVETAEANSESLAKALSLSNERVRELEYEVKVEKDLVEAVREDGTRIALKGSELAKENDLLKYELNLAKEHRKKQQERITYLEGQTNEDGRWCGHAEILRKLTLQRDDALNNNRKTLDELQLAKNKIMWLEQVLKKSEDETVKAKLAGNTLVKDLTEKLMASEREANCYKAESIVLGAKINKLSYELNDRAEAYAVELGQHKQNIRKLEEDVVNCRAETQRWIDTYHTERNEKTNAVETSQKLLAETEKAKSDLKRLTDQYDLSETVYQGAEAHIEALNRELGEAKIRIASIEKLSEDRSQTILAVCEERNRLESVHEELREAVKELLEKVEVKK